METRASHVLIGAFAFATLILGFLFVLWLGKLSLDREWEYYDIVFTEAVTGLTVGGAVQYNGIQIGEVRKLSLDPKDPARVIAHTRVAGDTPVKVDTRAKLALTGLTGVAVIQLSGGTANAAPLQRRPGQAYPTIVADTSALQKLITSSEDIITSLNDVVLRVSSLLGKENLDKIDATLDHIEQITSEVSGKRTDIGALITNLRDASDGIEATLRRADAMITRMEAATGKAESLMGGEAREALDSARQSLDSARRFTDSAYTLVEQNRDAFANFSNQGLAQAGPVLAELRATLRKLQAIADRLEADPTGYVLGKDQPKEYPAQ